MEAYGQAMARLAAVRDALNVADLSLAMQLLEAHDRELRLVFDQSSPSLARSEAEILYNAHRELLIELEVVKKRVEAESHQTRRNSSAARAYLGNAGG